MDKEQRLEPPIDDWDFGEDEEDEDYENAWPDEGEEGDEDE